MEWVLNENRYLKSYSSLSLLKSYFQKYNLSASIQEYSEDVVQANLALSTFKTIVGMFALGRYNLELVNEFTTNRYFQDSLGIEILPTSDKLIGDLKTQTILLREASHKINLNSFDSSSSRLALNLSELYKTNTFKDKYIVDFNSAEWPSDFPVEMLREVHYFATGCLRAIAASGITGEIQSGKSLFTDKVKNDLSENGYATIERVLPENQVDQLRELITTICDLERKKGIAYLYGGGDRCQRIYNILNKHESFRELIQIPLVLEIMEHMFARNTLHDKYILSSWHSNIIGSGGESSILHVDSAVPEPLPPWTIRVNVNFMLDDFTFENGATLCLPGSHKFLKKPTKQDQNRPDLVPMLAPKGSLGIWTGHLWHKSGENKTDKSRIALLGCFAASHLREMAIEEDHLRVIDKEIVEGMSPTLKKLIGFGYGIKKGATQRHPEIE